jgi:hypothetical protein
MVVKNLAKALSRYDIRTAEYRKPPAGKEVFAITILNRKKHGHDRGVVTLNHGQAKVEVFGSRKLRQAAVTVNEKARTITRNVRYNTVDEKRPNQITIEARLKGNFPMAMPKETTWEVRDVEIKRDKLIYTDPPRYEWKCQGIVTATVPNKSTNHFLIGMDETHHFIAPLPKQAKSVEEAHKLLRGEVPKGATRQGEWFFLPVTRKMAANLNKIATERSSRIRAMRLGDSTHVAKTAISMPGGIIYARGYITDNRSGHHRSIFLTSWHRVKHNEETQMQISPAQRQVEDAKRAARRFRTWD